MASPPHASDGRTLLAAVLFADLVGYSKRSVTDQLALKDAFRGLVQESLAPFSSASCVLLDTGDGAAIAFLRDPEHALYVALRLRHAVSATGSLRPEDLRIGINLGPVRRAVDVNGRPNLVGDGFNAAERIMSFAVPGDATCSRSFHDAVACLHECYPGLFEPLGLRADKHGRDYEVFRMRQSDEALAVATTSLDETPTAAADPPPDGDSTPPRLRIARRNALAVTLLLVVVAATAWLSLRPFESPSAASAGREMHTPASAPATQAPVDAAPSGVTRDESAQVSPSSADPATNADARDDAEARAAPSEVESPASVESRPAGGAVAPRRASGARASGATLSAKCSMLIQKASVGELTPAERNEFRSGCR